MSQLSSLLFVVNPVSGGKHKKSCDEAIKKFFATLHYQIEIYNLCFKNDAEVIKETIDRVKPQTVVAVGGDGTVTLLAEIVRGTDITLAIVPAGSANGMAHELEIPLDVEEALKVILLNNVRKLDAICVNKRLCLHLSDIGLNAKMIKYFDQDTGRGIWGYAKVALKVLFKKQNIKVVIQEKDQQLVRKAFMVVIANASRYGTGAVINPGGSLYDGFFEVVIIKRLGVFTILKMWIMPRKHNTKNIEVIHASSVHLETHRPVHFQIDGEYLGKVQVVDAEIIRAQLNMALPK